MKQPIYLLLSLCVLSSATIASALNVAPVRAGCSAAELALAKHTAQQALSKGDTRSLAGIVHKTAACYASDGQSS